MATTALDITLTDATAGAADGKFTATLVWTLQVEVSPNAVDMLPDSVAGAFGNYLPIEGTMYHPGRPFVTCRSVECARVKGGVYTYTAKYSDENSHTAPNNENPLLEPPLIRPMAGLKERAIYRDRDDKAILNAANDPIIQTMEDNIVGFRISANVSYVPVIVLSLRNTCNASPISVAGLGIGSNMARFILPSDWLSEPKIKNEIPYFTFSYELAIDERDRHYGVPLDAGFRELVNGEQKRIVGKDGSEPDDPVPLNADGTKIDTPTPDNVRYLDVKKYGEADYSILPGVN